MTSPLRILETWQAAGLIDTDTAGRIRQWEADRNRSTHPAWMRNWAAILAAALGGILLSSGILLLLVNYWREFGEVARVLLVSGVFAVLHVAGFAMGRRGYPKVSMALHAAGTLSLGGAIAVIGEWLHLERLWPSTYLVWAGGAVIGWLRLRDWPHAAMVALLVPSFLTAEWISKPLAGGFPMYAGWLALSLIYLGARRPGHGADGATRTAIVWIGGVIVMVAALITASERHTAGAPNGSFLLACAIAATFCLGAWILLRGASDWLPPAIIFPWVAGLYLLHGHNWGLYAWCFAGACGLAAWGVYESRVERINLGIAGVAMTLVFFFFTNFADKLSRSLSLLALGCLFLVGGWLLEKTRRHLAGRATDH